MLSYKEIVHAVLFFLLAGSVIFFAVFGLAYMIEKARCQEFSLLNPDLEFKNVFWSGCLVKTPQGYYLPVDENMIYVFADVNLSRLDK